MHDDGYWYRMDMQLCQARSQQWGRVGPGPSTEGRGPPTEVGPHFHKGAPRAQIPLDLSSLIRA